MLDIDEVHKFPGDLPEPALAFERNTMRQEILADTYVDPP